MLANAVKRRAFFLALFCALTAQLVAQTNRPKLTLAGIINLPDRKCAVLKLPSQRPNPTHSLILSEGEREADIEVLHINPETGTVELRVAQTNAVLAFGDEAGTAKARAPSIVLTNASLDPVLNLYAECSGRTVLRSPSLPLCVFQIRASPANRAEAAVVFEKALAAEGIGTISDGEKFVRVAPKAAAAVELLRAAESQFRIAGGNEIILAGNVNWFGAEIMHVSHIYAELVGRKLDLTEPVPPTTPFVFKNQTSLTKEEFIHAMNVLLAWRNLKAVAVGDDRVKLVPLPAK